MKDFKLILSSSHNPAINLAYEEYLISKGEDVVYLWQNEPTVVIGRNQNPYKECNLSKIKEDGVHLMRRRSGGGTVFHDLGNLNFTIISSKYEGVVEDNFKLVNEALKQYKINALASGRNDLEIDGKKISGNAFFETENIFCHHGTLLIDVDLNRLQKYLSPSKLKLDAKGVSSVKSRVTNLKDINPRVTLEGIVTAFSVSLKKELSVTLEESLLNNKEIKPIIDKYNSYEWIFGESIEYNISFKEKFSYGLVELDMLIEEGFIKEANIYTDSIILDNFKKLAKSLIGLKFEKEIIITAVKNHLTNTEIISSFNTLLKDI